MNLWRYHPPVVCFCFDPGERPIVLQVTVFKNFIRLRVMLIPLTDATQNAPCHLLQLRYYSVMKLTQSFNPGNRRHLSGSVTALAAL